MAEAEAKPAPQKWWHWFLIYPALVTALMGALPSACQAVRAWRLDTTFAKVQIAEQQQGLWERNVDCLEAKPVYSVDVDEDITVGVTLCPSGDALLRYAVGAKVTYTWVKAPVPQELRARWDPHELVPDVDKPLATVRMVWGNRRCIRVTQGRVRRLIMLDGTHCAWEENRIGSGVVVSRVDVPCDTPCPD